MPLAADAVGRVGHNTVQVMTVHIRIAAKAGHIKMKRKAVAGIVAAVWYTVITGTRARVAADALGRVGHITVQPILALGLIAAPHPAVILTAAAATVLHAPM